MTELRELIRVFLDTFDAPATDAHLDLWEEVLRPYEARVPATFAAWVRHSETVAKPWEIVELIERSRERGSMLEIAASVAGKHRLGVKDLKGQNKYRRVAQPRQEAMWEMHQAGYSYPQIGRFLNRDHTTVMHGVRAHEARMGAEAR